MQTRSWPPAGWRLLLIVLVLVLAAPLLQAAERRVLIVGDATEIGGTIVAELRGGLVEDAPGIHVESIGADEIAERLAGTEPPTDLLITVGSHAALAVRALAPSVPLLMTAVTAEFAEGLGGTTDGRPASTALLLDQPLARQLRVLHAALPHLNRIGLLAARETDRHVTETRRAAADLDVDILVAEVDEPRLLLTRLARLLHQCDLLLVTPDPTIYNRFTLRNVLLTAYRQRKPVIGISSAYVNAGALLAVHATPQTIGREAAGIALQMLAGARLPALREPERFRISVNRRVARSLGLESQLPSVEALERAAGAAGNAP